MYDHEYRDVPSLHGHVTTFDDKSRNLRKPFLLRGNIVRRLIDTAIRWWMWKRAEKRGGYWNGRSKAGLQADMLAEFRRQGVEF